MSSLCEDLRVSAMNQGIAVLSGKRLCVVRREGGSSPFAVVRRKKNGMWLCHACLHAPSCCTHALAAREAGDNDQSEASGDDGIINGLGKKGSRRVNLVYSTRQRPLVPSQNSQAKHAAVLAAVAAGEMVVIPAPSHCPSCQRKKRRDVPRFELLGVIEFGTGSVASRIGHWRCAICKRTCVVDGLDEGLVICSQFTAYTEVFLFEAAVSLCRNASSLTSTYDLRAAFTSSARSTHFFGRSIPCVLFLFFVPLCCCTSTSSSSGYPKRSVPAQRVPAPTAAWSSYAPTGCN